jgi:hypothetical protein
MGEYSMSTQSVSVPDLIRLVGGVTDTFDEALVPVAVLLPPHPASTSANPSRTDGMTINGRFMSFSSLNEPSRGDATNPYGCVRIVVGYTMMQTHWQDPL